MAQPIVIPVELKIIPGGLSAQNRIVLTASGETVVDEYEQHVPADVLLTVAKICEAHARLLKKYSGTIGR